jgi:hypothetical protein
MRYALELLGQLTASAYPHTIHYLSLLAGSSLDYRKNYLPDIWSGKDLFCKPKESALGLPCGKRVCKFFDATG